METMERRLTRKIEKSGEHGLERNGEEGVVVLQRSARTVTDLYSLIDFLDVDAAARRTLMTS